MLFFRGLRKSFPFLKQFECFGDVGVFLIHEHQSLCLSIIVIQYERYECGLYVLIGFVNGMATDEADLTDEMYAKADMHDPDGRWQMIFGVNTIPEYRRQGCAERLLRRAIADAKERGKAGLVLTCKDKLLHYYGKLGFVNEGVSQSTHGGVVWYEMRLTF